jgi:very-short-patch-repair endonuclease
MPQLTKEYLQRAYDEEMYSTYEIAKACHTYPNKVRRALRKYGIPLRNKREAQIVALETGRHEHPTQGKHRTETEKKKIAEGVSKSWAGISDEVRNRRVLLAKQQWEDMSPEQRENLSKLAGEAVRKAAVEGSQLEKFLLTELRQRGYKVIFHKENLTNNEQLHVDLYLPDLRTAIEIDGPAHFYPIWGEEVLAKRLAADHTKTGLLISSGFVIIRVKNLIRNISKIQHRKLLTQLLSELECIQKAFPDETHRFIEIELA